jgi:hypothetical protein
MEGHTSIGGLSKWSLTENFSKVGRRSEETLLKELQILFYQILQW